MSPLTRIATSYNPTDAALWAACLEGAGFTVFLPGFHTANNCPHWQVGLGGLPIYVLRAEARAARAFLAAELETQENAKEAKEPPNLRLLLRFLSLFSLFFYTESAPAFSMLSLVDEDDLALDDPETE